MVLQYIDRPPIDDESAIVREDLSQSDETSGDASGGIPDLNQKLYNLLHWVDLGGDDLEPELEKLETSYPGQVHSELLYLLSHLRFSCEEARDHWRRICEQRGTMQQLLGSPVDLRVALVSYFVQVNPKFRNPKLIEMRKFEQTRASAYRDELTGLRNYRYFNEYLAQEIARSKQFQTPVSLVMIDVDDFKSYNDRNGHEAGNKALITVAHVLSEALRRVDVSARYGGEEFALVLPSTPKTGARLVAERVRQAVERQYFPHEKSQPGGKLTVSIGLATFPADGKDSGELIRNADSALYLAKAGGKNQLELYGRSTRSFRRVNASLNGSFCVVSDERHPLTTVKVSEGGMLFQATERVVVGSLLDVTLMLPRTERTINLSGRVVGVDGNEAGGFKTAIRITEIGANDRHLMSRYINDTETNAAPAAPAVDR